MSETPTKRPAKKAAAKAAAAKAAAPRARAAQPETPEVDMPIPEPIPDGVFVIDAVMKRYRYMFRGGRIMDVESPYGANSVDREAVLNEAHRRWRGKKDDWKIEGVTILDAEESPP